jgi:hypothetical protein
MMKATDAVGFDDLRPRLLVLLEQHRAAACEETRARVVGRVEELFLATAWNVAKDMLDHGWIPEVVAGSQAPRTSLRAIGGSDAA